MTQLWQVEDRGGVQVWTLCRPEARNALSRAARAELEALVEGVAAQRQVRAVVLSGQGERAFCAGADLKERRGMDEAAVRTWLKDLRRTLDAIEASPKVFIAAVHAAAFGGGLELALACDLRVVSASARMGLTETRLAIIPGGGGTQRLPRLVGLGRARDLILTGRRVEGAEALRIGLAERLCEASGRAACIEAALALAEEVAGGGPVALAKAKEAIVRGVDRPLSEGLEIEYECYQATLNTHDRLEALAAFAEKRPPVFRGE